MKVSDCCRKHGFIDHFDGMLDSEDCGVCPKCLEHCQYIEICQWCNEEIQQCTCDNEPKLFSWVDGVYKPENK